MNLHSISWSKLAWWRYCTVLLINSESAWCSWASDFRGFFPQPSLILKGKEVSNSNAVMVQHKPGFPVTSKLKAQSCVSRCPELQQNWNGFCCISLSCEAVLRLFGVRELSFTGDTGLEHPDLLLLAVYSLTALAALRTVLSMRFNFQLSSWK